MSSYFVWVWAHSPIRLGPCEIGVGRRNTNSSAARCGCPQGLASVRHGCLCDLPAAGCGHVEEPKPRSSPQLASGCKEMVARRWPRGFKVEVSTVGELCYTPQNN
ncbi:hypothetical protein Dimus_019753 [Dionaea muscipula]